MPKCCGFLLDEFFINGGDVAIHNATVYNWALNGRDAHFRPPLRVLVWATLSLIVCASLSDLMMILTIGFAIVLTIGPIMTARSLSELGSLLILHNLLTVLINQKLIKFKFKDSWGFGVLGFWGFGVLGWFMVRI